MAELPRGTRIGAYTLLSVLGRGGMGVVYEAEDAGRGRVAIKIVSEILARDAGFVGRFRREGRAGAAVTHPNVVGFLEAGEEAGRPYLVLELVRGGTLREEVRSRGHLEWREAAELGAGIARGLAAVHEAGLVHRDLKPENVLLSRERVPKLSDFGLVGAHAASLAVSQALTRTGELVGTLAYMAPEQANAEKNVGPSADLYSLGALLHFILTGDPPFAGQGYELVKKHLMAKPRSPRESVPGIPESLEKLVLSLLEKKPERRPSSAGAVADALEAISRERPARGLAWLLGGAAALVLVAGGAIGFLAFSSEPEPEKAPSPTPVASSVHSPAAPPRDEVRSLIERGSALAKKQDFEGARSAFTRAIELDPRRALAWAKRGEALFALHDVDGALRDFTKAIELDPRLASAWESRAIARAVMGDDPSAIADATRAIELDPLSRTAWGTRGNARARRGDLDGALSDLSREIEIEPGAGTNWGARAALRYLKRDMDGTIADATKAIELEPRFPQAWRLRAGARMERRDLERSIADIERYLELALPEDPEIPPAREGLARMRTKASPPRDAASWSARAGERCQTGDVQGALDDATEALELDPRLTLAWAARSSARIKANDFDGALSDANRAIELEPRNAKWWSNRGVVRLNRRELDMAHADLTRALELDPGLADAWEFRGGASVMRNDLDAAIKDYTRSVEADPRRASAWNLRGSTRAQKNDFAGAIEDFTRALEIEPGNTNALWNRAASRGRNGDPQGSLADFRRIIEVAPDSPEAAKAPAEIERLTRGG